MISLAHDLGSNLKSIFNLISQPDDTDIETERGLASNEFGRGVALPALMHEAILRDLRLDLSEVSDVLLREILIPGDPEEARLKRSFLWVNC
jgi:hypothetical protein